jgi:addiction module RelB/DinJ family antitoxin
MAATALVQTRIEPETKFTVDKIFAEYGMNTSTAIRKYLNHVAQTRSLSFQYEPEAEDEEDECSYEPTPEFAAYLDKAIADIKAGRNLLEFNSNEEALAYFDSLI